MRLASLTGAVVLCPDGDPTVAFAADELAAYLGRIYGVAPTLAAGRSKGGAWLRLAASQSDSPGDVRVPAGAEGVAQPDPGGITMAATTPRALLGTVYGFLEALGCRWSPHGPANEHVPHAPDVPAEAPRLIRRPAFDRRAYASDLATWHYTMPERLAERLPSDLDFIDWLAKSGATGFFFIRHANDSQWALPELLPALRTRGLALEVGGHALVELLPRELFAEHPEWFPVGPDGRRNDLGNVCPSSPDALAVVSARSAAIREALPDAAELHLWGLDLLGGGWCRCPGCEGLTPSDQALTVCNRVAEHVDGRLFHLAYHDTLRPPTRVRPHARVWAEFAPRERCYGHALDDDGCATNTRYRESLARHLELFGGRVHAFEYYGDAILFGGCAVPLVEVIGRDLAYYRRMGVRGISCLTFGTYSLWAYGANLGAFADGALDPGAASRGADRYCALTFRSDAPAARHYLQALERLMAPLVSHGDVLLPPRADAGRIREALAVARSGAPTVRALLDEAGDARFAAQQRLFDYTVEALAAVAGFVEAIVAGASPDVAVDDATRRLARALAHVQAVERSTSGTWGAYDLELVHHFYAAALRA